MRHFGKRVLGAVLCAALLLCTVPAGSIAVNAATSGDYEYEVLEDGTASITQYTGDDRDVVIPGKIDEYTVTSIGGDAFSGCTSLTSVTIPDSVTIIGEEAFSGCTALTAITVDLGNSSYCDIDGVLFNKEKTELLQCPGGFKGEYTIPDSVTSIGDRAFSYCTSLTSITIPDSVTTIGYEAFADCTSLTSITIPDSVTSIGSGAFDLTGYVGDPSHWENGLLYIDHHLIAADDKTYDLPQNVTIRPGTTTIGWGAFDNCTSLTSVTIPDSVIAIDSYAFSNCASLTFITIPDSVITISGRTFLDCTSLTSVTISNSVTTIGNAAFSGCTSLTFITIPDSVTTIGHGAFSFCTSLTSITIPDSVTTIGGEAFYDCTSLNSITIPDSVTTIGTGAFENCTSLTSITIPDSVTSIGGAAFDNTGYVNDPNHWKNGLLYIDHHLIAADDKTYDLPQNVTIRPGTTTIAGDAFEYCTSLISVTIPDSVTAIGGRTFLDCTSLTSVIISDKVTTIGSDAFNGCTSLISIIIPNNVTTIEADVFYGCTSLTFIDIPDSVTSIGSDAFYNTGYYNDPSHWENGVLYIGHHLIAADEETYDLPQNVTVRPGTVSIADSAFSGCTSLTSVSIPDSVISIGYAAFAQCFALTSVTIPDSVISIGSSAFYDTGYTNDPSHWEDGLLYIGHHLIESIASNLHQSISIRPGTITIADSVFLNCTSLTSVTIPDSVTTIGGYSFADCTSLISVTIPTGVTEIGPYALGYFLEADNFGDVYTVPLPNFTISGFTGTAAEEYANENGFKFIALDSAGDSLADVDTDGDGEISTAEAQDFYISFYDALANGNPPAGADVSGDGRVDIEDVLTVYLIASGRA